MRRYLLIVLLCLSPAAAAAQIPNAGPNDSFGWNQVASTLTEAQNFVYKYYLDGAVTGSTFTAVTCAGTATPFTCSVRIPALSLGQHQITFTASNTTGESGPSLPFAFVYGNPPSIPNNIRIIKAVP